MPRFLLICLLSSCSYTTPAQDNTPTSTSQPTSTPVLRFWLAGDIHLGQSRDPVLSLLRAATKDFGCGIINLEGAISSEESQIIHGKPNLFNHPNTLWQLTTLGVCAASIANNHALDAGSGGPNITAKALQQDQLLPIGGPAGFAVLQRGSWKVALTSHDLTDGVPSALFDALRAAKQEADLLISTFHVTGPPSYLPTKELKQATQLALDAGARLIVSHGSHMLGPVERRGDAIIAWGLGNVAFSCDCTQEEEAILLRIQFDGQTLTADVVPILAGLKGAAAQIMPEEKKGGIFDLLQALGSSPLIRYSGFAVF
jgi:hypothetical protein